MMKKFSPHFSEWTGLKIAEQTPKKERTAGLLLDSSSILFQRFHPWNLDGVPFEIYRTLSSLLSLDSKEKLDALM